MGKNCAHPLSMQRRSCQREGCRADFTPDFRRLKHQKYCSPPCRRLARKACRNLAKRRYLLTPHGKRKKSEENARYRIKVGWNDYMRRYLLSHPNSALPKEAQAEQKHRSSRKSIKGHHILTDSEGRA